MDNVVLKVVRGGLDESSHRGHVVVVDAEGNIVGWYGDKTRFTLSRSSLKPIQSLAVVTSGAVDKYRLADRHLAVTCGSHYGQAEHQQSVIEILNAIGLSIADLDCGSHEPIDTHARKELARLDKQPSAVHNNCSGKHAGMLAVATALGVDHSGYIEPGHKVQTYTAGIVADMAAIEVDRLAFATDGCGVPSYGFELWRIAYMFARMSGAKTCPDGLSQAVERVGNAMVNEPVMVAGNKAFDTELMSVGQGRFVTKSGADGVHCVAVRERGLGVVVKIEDGGHRAVPPVMMSALDQLGLLTDQDKEQLARFVRPILKNNRDEQVGELVADWSLREAN